MNTGVSGIQFAADWTPIHKPTELSRIELKTWTQKPAPMKYDEQAFRPLHATGEIGSLLTLAIYIVECWLCAAIGKWFPIKWRRFILLWCGQDSNPGVAGTHSPTMFEIAFIRHYRRGFFLQCVSDSIAFHYLQPTQMKNVLKQDRFCIGVQRGQGLSQKSFFLMNSRSCSEYSGFRKRIKSYYMGVRGDGWGWVGLGWGEWVFLYARSMNSVHQVLHRFCKLEVSSRFSVIIRFIFTTIMSYGMH